MLSRRGTPLERFMKKVMPVTESGCWLWTGHCQVGGYGQFYINEGVTTAHRASHLLFKGPIPEGKHIDHLCRVTCCVNPDHLEAVTQKVNNLRSNSKNAHNARKTHCQHGHPLAGYNLIVKGSHRSCRTCKNALRRTEYYLAWRRAYRKRGNKLSEGRCA